ncbi:MAG: hypothetical protein ABI395_05865 [Sphingobium sp.]
MPSDQPSSLTSETLQPKARSVEDRLNEIAVLNERRFRSPLLRELAPEVAKAYMRAPLGPYDDRTARVARAFGRLPLAYKEVVVPLGIDGPYAIARIAEGEPGGLIEETGHYDNYQDAFVAIFESRLNKISK